MDDLLYFDCHASFGPHCHKYSEARFTQQHLIEDFDLAGIAGGLVTHAQALEYDPMRANLQLVDSIASCGDRLFACWVVMPNTSGDFPEVAQLIELMHQHDVPAVRIEPSLFGLPVCEDLFAELRDALVANDLLVVTSFKGHDAALRFLEIFRDANVLLTDHTWANWREVAHLMRRFDKLHIEFSSFQANRAVEWFSNEFGARRCLFGTNLPHKAPGTARGFFDWSNLPHADLQLMAGDNLRRLLHGQGPTTMPAAGQWHDPMTTAARAGQALPCFIADAHCHMLHEGANTAGKYNVMLQGGPAGMHELATRVGIDRTAVMSWAGPLCCDTQEGNRHIEQAVNAFPDHFIGVATVNPEHDSPADIDQIIQHYHVELGFPGLKTIISSHNLRYDDPLFDKWYGYGDAHHLYAVVDTCSTMDDQIANLAQKFPNLGIHLDHFGRGWKFARWGVSLMKQHPNIWAQLNYTAATNGLIEWLIEQVGADRILFGTDAPMRDPRPQASWLTFTRISEGDKRKIFGENFAGILRAAGVDV